MISKETLLTYPNFTLLFDINNDASHNLLGSVISQSSQPIAFHCCKLYPAQTRYEKTECDFLAVVEAFNDTCHVIKVYTNHKNLTYGNFNTGRIMRLRLILE
jgi:RNase H-like domain found in reverse transcriptase